MASLRQFRRLVPVVAALACLVEAAPASAAPNPVLSASPRRGNFGRVLLGQEAQRSFIFTNVSNEVVDSVQAFEPDSSAFYLYQEDCSTRSPLQPGATCEVAIRFQPSLVGRSADTLYVWAFGCSVCTTSISVPLRGTGITA
jgi:hypothetical protein